MSQNDECTWGGGLENHGVWAKMTSLHWGSKKTWGMGQNDEFGGRGVLEKTWGMGQNDKFALGVLEKHGIWTNMMSLHSLGVLEKHGV